VLWIEVACASSTEQHLRRLAVLPGTTVRAAFESSGLVDEVVGLDLEGASFGIHGRVVSADQRLREGDRIELLRPLRADPKEVRRALAAEGRTMGKPRDRA